MSSHPSQIRWEEWSDSRTYDGCLGNLGHPRCHFKMDIHRIMRMFVLPVFLLYPVYLKFTGKAFVAYTDSDGKVGLITVIQQLNIPRPFTFGCLNAQIISSFSLVENSILAPNSTAVSLIQWHTIMGLATLIVSKPGFIHVYRHLYQDGPAFQSFRIPPHMLQPGCSTLQAPTTTMYISASDCLLIVLCDASCLVLRGVSTSIPKWSHSPALVPEIDSASSRLRRFALGRDARTGSAAAGSLRITGMEAYDPSGIVVWAHE